MEKELINDFLRIMNRFKTLKFNKHMSEDVHHGEYRMMFAISEFMGRQEDGSRVGIKVSELADCMYATRSAVSKMLNTLEQKQRIERIVDKEDRRVTYVRLTKSGEDCIKKAMKVMETSTIRIIEQLGEQDLKALIQVMERIFVIMQEEVTKS